MKRLCTFVVLLFCTLCLFSSVAFADNLPPLIPHGDIFASTEAPALPDDSPSTEAPTLPDDSPSTEAPTLPDDSSSTEAPTLPDDSPSTEAPTLPDDSSNSLDSFVGSSDMIEVLELLRTICQTLLLLVHGIIPVFFAMSCIFFLIRWFSRTFFSL